MSDMIAAIVAGAGIGTLVGCMFLLFAAKPWRS
jgi:F0F1-type ATP synthase assembly protein I